MEAGEDILGEHWYHPSEKIKQFHASQAYVRFLLGGRGCIHGSTRIYDPTDGTNETAEQRYSKGQSFHVYALTPQGVRTRSASAPFVKGVAPLMSVEIEGCSTLILESQHKLLTPYGWKPVDQTTAGFLVGIAHNLPQTSEGVCLSKWTLGARHWWQTIRDYRWRYSGHCHPYDERLQWRVDGAQGVSPSQGDVPRYSHFGSNQGDRSSSVSHSQLPSQRDLLARIHSVPSFGPCLAGDEAGSSGDVEALPIQSIWYELFLDCIQRLKQHLRCYWASGTSRLRLDDPMVFYKACEKNIRWAKILSISSHTSSTYYDLTVDGNENYMAEGIWHHNSSKTCSSATDALGHALHTAGGRVVVLRKTKESNVSTSVKTFNEVYSKNGLEESPDDTSLFKKWDGGTRVRIPSEIALEKFGEFMKRGPRKSEIQKWIKGVGERYCTFIDFKGVKDEKISENTLRGLECTMLILIEADMLTRDDFDMALQCLRLRDAFGNHVRDKNCIVETNPPGPTHWIAQLETEKTKTGAYPDYEFWHLKTAENAHNLDPGDPTAIPPVLSYLDKLKRSYEGNPAMYARMVDGEYSEAHPGNPVFYRFNISKHKGIDLAWPDQAYLIRTWDFGVFNAVCWAAYFTKTFNGKPFEYLHFLSEQYIEGSDVEYQAQQAIKLTEEVFPFWNDREKCSGIKDYADPSGRNVTGMGIEAGKRSYFQVLHTHGIAPGYKIIQNQPSIALVNRALGEYDPDGNPMIRIDEECCPLIVAGCSGKYRYPAQGEAGYGLDNATPIKGSACDNIDHICLEGYTLIATELGEVPIKSLGKNNKVWTRKGLRSITAWAMTQENAQTDAYYLSNGKVLIATPDHPVWVKTHGWKRIDELTSLDILEAWNQNQSHSIESPTGDTLPVQTRAWLGILDPLMGRVISIAQSTWARMGPYRKAFTSIIKMAIHSTIRSIIWNAYRPKTTSEESTRELQQMRTESYLLASDLSQSNGTEVRREENGIGFTAKKTWIKDPSWIWNASTAKVHSGASRHGLASVPTDVKQRHVENQELITSRSNAPTAEQIEQWIKTCFSESRDVRLVAKRPNGKHDVYNITVEEEHEYFANGILVSNCDVFRYTIHNTMRLLTINDAKGKPPVGKLAQKYKSPGINRNDMYGKRPKPMTMR